MTTIEKIVTAVAAGESETMEIKATTGSLRQAAMTTCAMLNGCGGQVLFDVTPEGHAVGQLVSERTIEAVSAELQRIDPPAYPGIERVSIAKDLEVIVVAVTPGFAKPYQYKGTAYHRDGEHHACYVR